MTWKIQVNAELGLIETIYSGQLTKQEALEATAETLAQAAATGDGPYLFLSDFLDAESVQSTLDLHSTPSEWEATGVSRASKLALIVPKGGKGWEDARFYETTCRNRGWQVAVFSQRQEAMDWLTGQRPSSTSDTDDG